METKHWRRWRWLIRNWLLTILKICRGHTRLLLAANKHTVLLCCYSIIHAWSMLALTCDIYIKLHMLLLNWISPISPRSNNPIKKFYDAAALEGFAWYIARHELVICYHLTMQCIINIQLSAVITRSNMTWCCTYLCCGGCEIYIRV